MRRAVHVFTIVAALWVAAPALPVQVRARAFADAGAIRAVDSVAMVVDEMDRSLDFFTRVLTFEKVSDVELTGSDYEHLYGVFALRLRIARLRLGDEFLELMDFIAPEGRPIPADSRSNDLWFQHVAIIVSDMDAAYARLRLHNVRHASAGPQRLPDWNPNAGGIQAFYFKDPDGHVLEILEFPQGKGAAKWHSSTGKLFLGIDHTAIVVGDTAAALKFYRDGLGLGVAGESENYGIEQERLNGVFGARLRITALRAPQGPGIEFLEYLAPADGRQSPSDVRPNDIVAWQTRLATSNVSRTLERLRGLPFTFVSPGVVQLEAVQQGINKGVLVRDPDAHALLLAERPVERNTQ